MAEGLLTRIHTSPDRIEVLYKSPPHLKRLKRDPLLEDFANHLLKVGHFDAPGHSRQRPLKVKVAWNPAMRTTIGRAYLSDKMIVLNPKLIETSPGEVQRTLRHELAHILAQHRAGRKPIADHGKEWRQACADLGIPNESVCHTLTGPFQARRLKPKYFYACPACNSQVQRVIALKYRAACVDCCDKYNKGKYSERFRLQLINPATPPKPQKSQKNPEILPRLKAA
jgi:SprT protein